MTNRAEPPGERKNTVINEEDLAAGYPSPVTSPPVLDGGELQRRYGSRWTLAADPARGVWSAEFRSPDGRHRRYIVAESAGELDHRLQAAERADQ